MHLVGAVRHIYYVTVVLGFSEFAPQSRLKITCFISLDHNTCAHPKLCFKAPEMKGTKQSTLHSNQHIEPQSIQRILTTSAPSAKLLQLTASFLALMKAL